MAGEGEQEEGKEGSHAPAGLARGHTAGRCDAALTCFPVMHSCDHQGALGAGGKVLVVSPFLFSDEKLS